MDQVEELKDESRLARRGKRLGAAFLDFVVLAIFMVPVSYFLGMFDYARENQQPPIHLAVTIIAINVAIFLAINWKLLSQNAQTIGKYVLDIRIVNIDGSKPPIKDLLFKRYLVFWGLPYIPYIGWLLNLVNICCIFKKDRRCVHDMVAGTEVVNS